MDQHLELPAPVMAALQEAAIAAGTTPAGWVAARLAEQALPAGGRTLADLFAGRLGRVASGDGTLSTDGGRAFAEHLEARRQAGRL